MTLTIDRLVNLRRDPRSGALIPAELPQSIGTVSGTPAALLATADGNTWVAAHAGPMLFVYNAADGTLALTANTGADITAIHTLADDTLVVDNTSDAGMRARYVDGTWRYLGAPTALPLPRLYTRTKAQYSARVPLPASARVLHGDISSLDGATLHTLSANLERTYNALTRQALSDGAFIQPVLAAVTLVGHHGECLLRTTPVLLTPSERPLNALSTTFALTTEGTPAATPGGILSAAGYDIAVEWPASYDRDLYAALVHHVEVDVTPQLHPLAEGAPTVHRVTTTRDGYTLIATLPGNNIAEEEPSPAYMSRLLRALSTFHADAYTIAHLRPGTPGSTDEVSAAADGPVRGNVSPYSLGARRMLHTPEALVMADLTLHPRLPSLRELTRAEGVAHPLIALPYPEMTQYTLAYGNEYVTLPLTPTPDGQWAVYVDPMLQPIPIAGNVGTPPRNRVARRRRPDMLAVAPPGTPQQPQALLTLPDGDAITALAPAQRAHTAWRAVDTVVSVVAGATLYNLDTSRRRLTPVASGLPPGGVLAPTASALLLAAGDTLYSVTPSGMRRQRQLPAAVTAMASTAGELWMLLADGRLLILPDVGEPYELTLRCDALTGALGSVWMLQGSVLRTSAHRALPTLFSGGVYARMPSPPRSRMTDVTVSLTGTAIHGALTVATADAAVDPDTLVPLTSLALDGDIDGPVRVRARTPLHTNIFLTLRLTADTALRINMLSANAHPR